MRTGKSVKASADDRRWARLAVLLTAAATGVAPALLLSKARLDLQGCRARWLTLYLSHDAYGWTVERVGGVFGLSRSAVVNACRWVEDRRDDPALDALLDGLTELARQAAGGAFLDLTDAGPGARA